MDLWLLGRLADTVALCNKGFELYELPIATTAIYNFFLYNLCDVYLVRRLELFPLFLSLSFSGVTNG